MSEGQGTKRRRSHAKAAGKEYRPRRAATQRADGEDVPFIPNVVPHVEGAKPRGGWKCLRCGVSPSENTPWALHDESDSACGNACLRCWKPYRAEYQRYGTWDQVCGLCDEDEDYNPEYEQAAKVLST